MKLAIIGGRDFTDFDKAIDAFDKYFRDEDGFTVSEIVSGGALGADTLAKKIAEWYPNLKYTEFPADWEKYGRSAGPRRNEQIINACDMVLAFWNGESRGTANSLSLAKKAKKNTIIIYY